MDQLTDLLEDLPNAQGLDPVTYAELKKVFLAIRRLTSSVSELQVITTPVAPTTYRVYVDGHPVTTLGNPVYASVT